MSSEKPSFDASRYLDVMSSALNLSIPAERRAGVEQFLHVAFAMSQIVGQAPLNPDASELAAVFRPGSIEVKP